MLQNAEALTGCPVVFQRLWGCVFHFPLGSCRHEARLWRIRDLPVTEETECIVNLTDSVSPLPFIRLYALLHINTKFCWSKFRVMIGRSSHSLSLLVYSKNWSFRWWPRWISAPLDPCIPMHIQHILDLYEGECTES